MDGAGIAPGLDAGDRGTAVLLDDECESVGVCENLGPGGVFGRGTDGNRNGRGALFSTALLPCLGEGGGDSE